MREQRWVFGRGPEDEVTLSAIERALELASQGYTVVLRVVKLNDAQRERMRAANIEVLENPT